MRLIPVLFLGLSLALSLFSSCSTNQEKTDRTEKVDESVYAQDSAETEQLIDSLSMETSDSLSFNDGLNELDMMDAERAAEKAGLDQDDLDATEIEDEDQ